eukprot:CAMPEP_0202721938 /NCGR_PEP_ID=MMETSP1385-20130828/152982_1 /ASSEMBLY_ACC=CAM_ASM_000861 /TAXON_ID=933848 /ORGANISM="Elphidium margaritaceum" /LENGTH=31 /DNA_ID= /DNA_START= /DNA_END= /DNA_ORIENTATION=
MNGGVHAQFGPQYAYGHIGMSQFQNGMGPPV